MFLVDSHCHLDRLDLTPYDDKLSNALSYANDLGVGHMLCVSINMENFKAVIGTAKNMISFQHRLVYIQMKWADMIQA